MYIYIIWSNDMIIVVYSNFRTNYKVMKGLPNTCHNYRTERFQIPIKPFLFENLDLFGNPVVTLIVDVIKTQNAKVVSRSLICWSTRDGEVTCAIIEFI